MDKVNQIIKAIKEIETNKKPIVIAIDGRAASGKTTLAKYISEIMDCDVIHLDDFFLPSTLRTEERLKEVGGNIHYERFKKDVINHLSDDHFTFSKFNCRLMREEGTVSINKHDYLIIEGSYALHPYFGHYYDFSIFSDVDENIQLMRIENRNGMMQLQRFKDEWIPKEEAYFKLYEISNKVNISIKQ